MLAVVLQAAGFVGAVVLLVLTCLGIVSNPVWFVLAFALHFSGDTLFILAEGLPKMSFLDNLDQYVKLPAFIQFVGTMILGGVVFFSAAAIAKVIGFLAFGIAMAGFIYDKIYQ